MTIKTSRNLDDIKPGGIAMLSKRQLKYSVITLIVTVVAIAILTVLGVPTSISGYVGLIVAVPVGYIGFFNRNGMNFFEYRKAKKLVNQPMLFYVSTENPDVPITISEQKEDVSNKGIIERLVSKLMHKKKGGVQSA